MILESFIKDVRTEEGDGPKADIVSGVAAGSEGSRCREIVIVVEIKCAD